MSLERNRKKRERKKERKRKRRERKEMIKSGKLTVHTCTRGVMPGFENFKIYGSNLKEVLVPMGGKVK